MNFGFSEEQELLRSQVRKWLDASCPISEVRRIGEAPGGPGFSRDHWKEIAELGWLGLTIPEAYGGAGLGSVDLVVLLEETGRSLFPSPLVSTVVAAAAIREGGSDAQRARWLPRLAEGSAIGTLAAQPGEDPVPAQPSGDGVVLRGEKRFVPDAAAASLYIVPCSAGLAVVERDASGVSAHDHPGIDLTKRVGALVLDGARGELLAGGSLERVLDLATAAVTAEAIGAAEAAVALTVAYALERTQFGSPIGRYQAVKHPLAEMHVDVESWKSLLYYAAWCLDEAPGEASRYVSMAKAYASEAFARIGIDAVQLHGAVGYTWEHDPHLFLKRSKWVRAMYGDADWHYDRVAAMGGLASEARSEPKANGGN